MRKPKSYKSKIKTDFCFEGKSIERMIEKLTTNKEPIESQCSLIFTERSKGVEPQYNIRTDRFEIALNAMDAVSKHYIAKREERLKLDNSFKEEEITGDPSQQK